MPALSCTRCFTVFDAPEGTGGIPLCPDCAERARLADRERSASRSQAPRRPAGRFRTLLAAVAVVAAVALAGALGYLAWRHRPRSPRTVTASPTAATEDRVEAWRAAGLVPPKATPAGRVDSLVAQGREGLRADVPARARKSLAAFREAVASAPDRADAAAGFAEAVADLAQDDPDADAEELRAAHEFLALAGRKAPGAPALQAARARLLLVVDAPANREEALSEARSAARAAPADPAVALALGLALLPEDPAGSAAALEEAWKRDASDRRVLSAAARARWAARDAPAALGLAAARLRLDPGHPGALAVTARVAEASGRFADARAALARWRAAAPDSELPSLLLARLAYEVDGDLPGARRLLAEALPHAMGPFAAARVLAHQAAVERLSGDEAAARRTAAEAVAKVPGSAPARFQAALLAWRAGDAHGLKESAGILGDRAGATVARRFQARIASLSGSPDEAADAWRSAAAAASSDPVELLAIAGTLARLGASGTALEVARRFLARDPLEARLVRVPEDAWEGAGAAAEACDRLAAIARAERSAAAVALSAAAACEIAFGHTSRAESLAKAASGISPQAAAPLWVRAQVALDRGKAKAALPLAADAVEADPRSAVALEVRARALAALGRADAAASDRAAALALVPDLATARLARARAVAAAGRTDEARALARALADERPELAEPRGMLLDLAGPPAAAAR